MFITYALCFQPEKFQILENKKHIIFFFATKSFLANKRRAGENISQKKGMLCINFWNSERFSLHRGSQTNKANQQRSSLSSFRIRFSIHFLLLQLKTWKEILKFLFPPEKLTGIFPPFLFYLRSFFFFFLLKLLEKGKTIMKWSRNLCSEMWFSFAETTDERSCGERPPLVFWESRDREKYVIEKREHIK